MQIAAPLIVAALVGLAVILFFMAMWLLLQQLDPVEKRLAEYGTQRSPLDSEGAVGDSENRYYRLGFLRFLAGFGIGPRLALALARADVPLTAAEFTLIIIGLAAAGFIVGTLRVGPLLGIGLGLLMAYLPLAILRIRQQNRLRVFTRQLPDVLTLLVGSLRAGYGLTQSLEVLVERIGPPASTELANVIRAVNLGVPVRRALQDAVERIGSDDFNLVVIAITVQYETGGNLAETLEIIGETVRDRLQLLAEIRVLTAQQRYTGYVLAMLPLVVALFLFLVNPEYLGQLFEPGWVRLLPIGAVIMQVLGFLFIRKIVDIEV